MRPFFENLVFSFTFLLRLTYLTTLAGEWEAVAPLVPASTVSEIQENRYWIWTISLRATAAPKWMVIWNCIFDKFNLIWWSNLLWPKYQVTCVSIHILLAGCSRLDLTHWDGLLGCLRSATARVLCFSGFTPLSGPQAEEERINEASKGCFM